MQRSLVDEERVFLIKLKSLALTLSLIRLDASIDAIKRCVLEYQHCIPEEKPALDFIEQLIFAAEKETTASEKQQFLAQLSAFWQWMVLRRPFNLIYVGQKKNLALIKEIPSQTSLHCCEAMFVDGGLAEDALDKLSLPRPVLLVDNEGELRVDSEKYLGVINIETPELASSKRGDLLGIIRKNIDMIGILNSNLQRLKNDRNVNKVILGSSFAYYGMHDSLLNRAVNLAVASGDAAYNNTLVEHCISTSNVKNFVIVMGFFELFHQMSKGANGYFYLAAEFLQENGIQVQRHNTQQKPFLFHHEREALMELLQIDIYRWAANREITTLRKRASLAPEKPMDTDFIYSSEYTRRETEHFARFYDREDVAESNKRIFQTIVERVKQEKGKIYFVIQPFTPLYNALFRAEMRQETRDFLATVADGESSFFIDLSEDGDFTVEDYSDSHHLNFNGAQKLYRKLEWLQL